jgi:hypothetical protein
MLLLGRIRSPARYSKGDLGTIWSCNESTGLLCLRQPCQNVSESNCVCADTECWTPFLCDCLCETGDTGFGEGVVGLAGVAVEAAGGGNVDDVSWFAILDAEVWCRSADQLEGCAAVEGDDCVPLLVGGLRMISRMLMSKTALLYSPCE